MNLSKLKMKKLMNELNYLKLDLSYKQEMLDGVDIEFLKMMNSVLESNSKLKETFEEKENVKIEDIINKSKNDEPDTESNIDTDPQVDENSDDDKNKEPEPEVIEKSKDPKNKKVKSLYREIVKLTHPDKIDNGELNRLYLEATDGYDNNDLSHLYLICDKLEIDYDIEIDDLDNIDTKVLELKNRSIFLENTYTWKWMSSNDDKEKKKIIIEFINMKLNN
jgi:hypothetical protein